MNWTLVFLWCYFFFSLFYLTFLMYRHELMLTYIFNVIFTFISILLCIYCMSSWIDADMHCMLLSLHHFFFIMLHLLYVVMNQCWYMCNISFLYYFYFFKLLSYAGMCWCQYFCYVILFMISFFFISYILSWIGARMLVILFFLFVLFYFIFLPCCHELMLAC